MQSILKNIENDNRLQLTFYLTLVGSMFMFVFGFISYNNQNPISFILFGSLIFAAMNVFILATQYKHHSRFGLVAIVGFSALSLIITGGQESTGILWTYPLLTVAFAVLTVKEGIWFSASYLLCSIVLMLTPFDWSFAVDYSLIIATRYIISVLTLCVMLLLFVRNQEHIKKELQTLTVTDNLTGLYNRAVLEDKGSAQIPSARKNFMTYLLLIDVDHFKHINDNFGHSIGDDVLVLLAKQLQEQIRNTDLAIRWGGEEFLLILKQCPKDKVADIADKIRTDFQTNQAILDILRSPPSLSIGVAGIVSENEFSDAIELADQRLYQAKQTGRNKVVFD